MYLEENNIVQCIFESTICASVVFHSVSCDVSIMIYIMQIYFNYCSFPIMLIFHNEFMHSVDGC